MAPAGRWARRFLVTAAVRGAHAARVAVIGGGASGVFAAIAAARRGADVTVLEATRAPLKKVLVSGGGRCNVFHDSALSPQELAAHYPRGQRELLGPFTKRFGSLESRAFFEAEGVTLKTEQDGRVFPTTDDSGTIASALLDAAERAGVSLQLGARVDGVESGDGGFLVQLADGARSSYGAVVLATGSSSVGYALAKQLGHDLEKPYPSLFSFRVPNSPLAGLSGLTLSDVELSLVTDEAEDAAVPPKTKTGRKKKVAESSRCQRGPLLVTHRGVSGPAALRLSAFAAAELRSQNYRGALSLRLLPGVQRGCVVAELAAHRKTRAKGGLAGVARPFADEIPRRLWGALCADAVGADQAETMRWADLTNEGLERLATNCLDLRLHFDGKDANKDEFVTAGGVHLADVDMRRFESRKIPGLFFCGELLNVDGVTGGFNFQNCWTSGHIAGTAAADTVLLDSASD